MPLRRPPMSWKTTSDSAPLNGTLPSTPSGTSFFAPAWKYLSLLPAFIAPSEPMPLYTLKLLPWKISMSPGVSSVPANRLPIMHALAPAPNALTMSPENLMPPSAMMRLPSLSAASAQSMIAVICGTPMPAMIRVVQMEPGPIPTLTTSAPWSNSALVPSAVATLPTM